jgi:ribonuclease D
MSENYKQFISKEEINDLPLLEYEGTIEIIETYEKALEAVKQLSLEKELGFDTESRPCFAKGESYPIAMIQLSTLTCAYLFRLNRMPFPKELLEILSNENIIKAGVGIPDDLKGIQKLSSFTPRGFVDLSTEAKQKGFTSLGLRALAAIFLGQRLSKAAKVTNWERVVLTEAQVKYAANDAMVGLKIYHKMINQK